MTNLTEIKSLGLNVVVNLFEGVTAPGKDGAGNATVERRQESKLALFERELRIAAAEFDAIRAGNFVDGGRVEAEGVQRVVQFMRRLFARRRHGGHHQTKPE